MELAVYSPLLMHNIYAEPEEAMKHARKLGITGIDIFGNELEEKKLTDYQTQCNRNGIKIRGIVQSAYLSDNDEKIRTSETDKVKRLVDLASKNGIERIMVAPQLRCRGEVSQVQSAEDKIFVRDTIITGMNEIVSSSKGSGIALTLENFSMNTHPFSTIEEMLYMLKNISGLKYTLDIGNFYCVREDVLKAYEVLKGYIQNVHIKDWIHDEFGYCIRPEIPALNGCIMGEGVLPLRELLLEMKKDGFDGEILLEVNTVSVTKQVLEASAAFVKNQWNRKL